MNIDSRELWKLNSLGMRIMKLTPPDGNSNATITQWSKGKWTVYACYKPFQLGDFIKMGEALRQDEKVIVVSEPYIAKCLCTY